MWSIPSNFGKTFLNSIPLISENNKDLTSCSVHLSTTVDVIILRFPVLSIQTTNNILQDGST